MCLEESIERSLRGKILGARGEGVGSDIFRETGSEINRCRGLSRDFTYDLLGELF